MSSFPVADKTPTAATLSGIFQWSIHAARAINSAMRGKINAMYEVGGSRTFTLTANAATTTISDERIHVDCALLFVPLTANAAAELYGATMYVLTANYDVGQAVITHANNAQADRSLRVVILG